MQIKVLHDYSLTKLQMKKDKRQPPEKGKWRLTFLRGGEGGKEQETGESAHKMAPAHLDHVELPEQRIRKVTMIQQATKRWRSMAHLYYVVLPKRVHA